MVLSYERHTVAAHIPTKNCVDLLNKCLESLTWVDEIIIGDASDNNDIQLLVKEKYPKVKHFFEKEDDIRLRLNKLIPVTNSDFILWVHTDEFYTEEAAQEILDMLKKPCEVDGFNIPSMSYNYGACLGEGDTQLRLFRKEKLYWHMDNIHEMPKVKGLVKTLKNSYIHNDNPILGMTAVKHFRYETINAFHMTDEQLEKLSLDDLSSITFHTRVLRNLIRINWRFIKTYWHYKKFGFAGLCMGYNAVLGAIASHTCPTEELRMRKKVISRDRRGYY